MDDTPDLTERSTADPAFYEWLLSDHPLAEAERRRRRDASFARRAAERERVREITGRWPADAPEEETRLRESLGRMADGQAQRDRWDQAVDEEIGLEKMRAQWETHMRVSGDDPDYRYPEHYGGPGASQYPPPLPAQDGRGSPDEGEGAPVSVEIPSPHLRFDGWLVAVADPADTDEYHGATESRTSVTALHLYRHPTGWRLLSLVRSERYRDSDRPSTGHASLVLTEHADVAGLRKHVERQCRSSAWTGLLDAGHGNDEALHAEWVPLQMERDFDRASVRGWTARRQADSHWPQDGIDDLAARLVEEFGYDVIGSKPGALRRKGWDEVSNRLIGTITVARYGWTTTALVAVDDGGEVYVRLDDPLNLRRLSDSELEALERARPPRLAHE